MNTPRELSGSKGRAALGSGIMAVSAALLASLKTLDTSVAITLIIVIGTVAVAYIWSTSHEDGKKADLEKAKAEVEKVKASLPPAPLPPGEE